ncbi:MAG: endonuclease/exonuclease/phosphatase family protein [Phycisphaerae bacterium]|nr:endonuclease/exonuclease/phosphatase family protein [Phycisphaerae bacterium]
MKSVIVLTLCCLLSLFAAPLCAASPDTLSIMTFNIRYGSAGDGPNHWDLRKDLVFSVLEDQQPDVVGLQEALKFQIDQMTGAVPGYTVIGVGRDDGKTKGEYSALLYRTDRFDVLNSSTFWLSETPSVVASMSWNTACTRICTWALFKDKTSERRFYVYNLHLDHVSQEARVKGVKLVLERIAQRKTLAPAFVTGDFNAGETNPAITQIKTPTFKVKTAPDAAPKTVHLVDTFRAIHPHVETVGTFNGFRGTLTGEKIDYVWVTDCLNIVAADILRMNTSGRYPSDHFPVVATVQWK